MLVHNFESFWAGGRGGRLRHDLLMRALYDVVRIYAQENWTVPLIDKADSGKCVMEIEYSTIQHDKREWAWSSLDYKHANPHILSRPPTPS